MRSSDAWSSSTSSSLWALLLWSLLTVWSRRYSHYLLSVPAEDHKKQQLLLFILGWRWLLYFCVLCVMDISVQNIWCIDNGRTNEMYMYKNISYSRSTSTIKKEEMRRTMKMMAVWWCTQDHHHRITAVVVAVLLRLEVLMLMGCWWYGITVFERNQAKAKSSLLI